MPIIFDESSGQASNFRRSHQPDAADAPNIGLEAVVTYNGLLLNDFRYMDRYQVLEMTGLDDADIRDSREDNPDDHGESVFNSFYGGRTITIRGRIIAGNFARLRKMVSNLKTAFGTLEEKELSFCYRDWDYSSFDQSWADDFLTSSTANITPTSNGYLSFSTTSTRTGLLDFKGVMGPDIEVIQEFKVGTAPHVGFRSVIKGSDVNNVLAVFVSDSQLSVNKVVAGSGTILNSINYRVTANTRYWTRGTINGNFAVAELWDEYPTDAGAPIVSVNTTLAGADATQFGINVTGFSGFSMQAGVADSTYLVGPLSVRNLNAKADYSIQCKKIGKIEILEQQNNLQPRRDFLITLRSSEPSFKSRGMHLLPANMSVFALTFPPAGGLTFPAVGGLSFLSGTIIAPNNLGNFPYNPIFKLSGTCTDPTILNQTTGQGIELNGLSIVSATNYILINCRDKTIKDDAGNSLYSFLSDSSEWIQLLPGPNTFAGGTSTGMALLNIYNRHSWL